MEGAVDSLSSSLEEERGGSVLAKVLTLNANFDKSQIWPANSLVVVLSEVGKAKR